MCVGLLMGRRCSKRRGAELRVAHEALSLATLAALARARADAARRRLSCIRASLRHRDPVRQLLQDASGRAPGSSPSGRWRCSASPTTPAARIGVQRWRRAAPLHRARLAARPRPLPRRGHRRGPDLVPGDDRHRRRAAARPARRVGAARGGAAAAPPARSLSKLRAEHGRRPRAAGTRQARTRAPTRRHVALASAHPHARLHRRRRRAGQARRAGARPRQARGAARGARGGSGASVATGAAPLFMARLPRRLRAARLRPRPRAVRPKAAERRPRPPALHRPANRRNRASTGESAPDQANRPDPPREPRAPAERRAPASRESGERRIGANQPNRAGPRASRPPSRERRDEVPALRLLRRPLRRLRRRRRRARRRAGPPTRRGAARSWTGTRAFSRFSPASELSLLNADPREQVPVSPLMARLAADRPRGGRADGRARRRDAARPSSRTPATPGIWRSRSRCASRSRSRRRAGPRGPSPAPRWQRIEVDDARHIVARRPPGVDARQRRAREGPVRRRARRDDSAAHRSFAIDCAGDLAIGGAGGLARAVDVESPFDGSGAAQVLRSRAGGVATSGIGRRSWLGRATGVPLITCSTRRRAAPAFTGVVQATALAPRRRSPRSTPRPRSSAAPSTAPELAALGRRARVRRRLSPRHRAAGSGHAQPALGTADASHPPVNRAASSEPPVASPAL